MERKSLPTVITATALPFLALASCLAVVTPAHGGNCPLVDAKGDAVDVVGGSHLIDIASADVRTDGETVYVDVTFFTAIAPASAFAENSVFGVMQFDTDQDPTTGGFGAMQNQWSPPFETLEFGSEYALAMSHEADSPGMLGLYDTLSLPPVLVAEVPVTYTSHGFSASFPLELLGDDDGAMDMVISAGDVLGPTDGSDAVGSVCAYCPADLDADGVVGVGDLVAVISGWGTDTADVDGDGTTDVADLVAVVSAWGTCG